MLGLAVAVSVDLRVVGGIKFLMQCLESTISYRNIPHVLKL